MSTQNIFYFNNYRITPTNAAGILIALTGVLIYNLVSKAHDPKAASTPSKAPAPEIIIIKKEVKEGVLELISQENQDDIKETSV